MPIVSYSSKDFPDLGLLDELIDRYRSMSASELVRKSHENRGAWDEIYNVQNKDSLRSDRGKIPFKLVIERMK